MTRTTTREIPQHGSSPAAGRCWRDRRKESWNSWSKLAKFHILQLLQAFLLAPNQPKNWRKIAISNSVGSVKHFGSTPLHALVEERHKQQNELIMEKHGLVSFIVHPDYIAGTREQNV
jgi:hypothetical protein